MRFLASLILAVALSIAAPNFLFAQSYLIGATIADGVNGSPEKISIVQIYNPATSGVVLFVTSVEPAWNATDSRITALQNKNGFDMGFGSGPIGDLSRYMISVDASITTNSPIELRTFAAAVPYPAYRLFFEKWPPQALYGFAKTFNHPLRIPPGYGMMVRPAQAYTWTIVTFEGYTVPVE